MSLILHLLTALALTSAYGAKPAVPSQMSDFTASRCINLSNALNAPKEGEWGYVIREDHLQRIALAGFDSVRVAIAWHHHAQAYAPYTIDPAFFNRIDQIVEQAQRFGLSIILDFHSYDPLYENPAAEAPRAVAIWDQIARHYAHAPNSVIFEILNEPQDNLQGKKWQIVADQLYAQVRISNPQRWLIMGGDNWNSIDGLARFDPPKDPRLMLTFHYYDPYKFTHQGATWFEGAPPAGRPWGSRKERQALAAEFKRAAAIGRKRGYALWLGEFGATIATKMDDRALWTREVRRAAQSHNMGWCAFDFAANFQVYSTERKNWVWPIRRALFDQEALALRAAPE